MSEVAGLLGAPRRCQFGRARQLRTEYSLHDSSGTRAGAGIGTDDAGILNRYITYAGVASDGKLETRYNHEEAIV